MPDTIPTLNEAEQILKDVIVQSLKQNIPDYAVRDFPLNLSDYKPTHPNGELLVKTLGMRPVQWIDGGRYETVRIAHFVIMEYSFSVDLVCKKIRSQNDIIELTGQVIKVMKDAAIPQISDFEAVSFQFIEATEPDYDEVKQFQFRTLTFTLPATVWQGE